MIWNEEGMPWMLVEVRLQEKTNAYNESQLLLRSLQKYEVKWGNKLEEAQAKAREIFPEKISLQDSLDAICIRKQGLEKEISYLNDEVVSTVSVYFERAKKQVLFLGPTLDLSHLDPFKILKGGVMVDYETKISPAAESFPTQEEGVTQKGGESERLQPEHDVEEEP